MNTRRPRYLRHRFPPEIISHAVWLYHRYCMSFRDVEDLLAERGIIVSYETIRQWCGKFGPDYARQLKRRQGRLGDTWFLDEVFVTINGERQYLWRAVDQDGDLIDILKSIASSESSSVLAGSGSPTPRAGAWPPRPSASGDGYAVLAPVAVDQAADLCSCGHENDDSAAGLVCMSWTAPGTRTTATWTA